MDRLFTIVSIVVYTALALLALWGAFCAVLVWMRVGHVRFTDEEEQDEFIAELDGHLGRGDFGGATSLCEDDRRALPQLALYGVENRDMGIKKLHSRLWERFQQDVLADIEHRLSWVATVVKSAPMVGLFGTVIGMMGAFRSISSSEGAPDPTTMANNIMLALITTACGLAIAVPLLIVTNSIVVRIRKMEELVGIGISRLIDSLKAVIGR